MYAPVETEKSEPAASSTSELEGVIVGAVVDVVDQLRIIFCDIDGFKMFGRDALWVGTNETLWRATHSSGEFLIAPAGRTWSALCW